MARPAKLSETILNGKASIYKIKISPFYQVRYRFGNVITRQSTGTSDIEEAKEIATEQYITARIKFKEGIPTVTKSTKSIAEYAKKRLVDAINQGNGKTTYAEYISIIDRWIIPFFGNLAITNITHKTLDEYDKFKAEKLGRQPSWSFNNAIQCALNRVFDEAVQRNYLTKSQVPEIKNNGVKTKRRPDFTQDEYIELIKKLKENLKRK